MILFLFSLSVSICWPFSVITSPLFLFDALSPFHLSQLFLILSSHTCFPSPVVCLSISSSLFLFCSVGLFPTVTYVLTIEFTQLRVFFLVLSQSSPVLSCLVCSLPAVLPDLCCAQLPAVESRRVSDASPVSLVSLCFSYPDLPVELILVTICDHLIYELPMLTGHCGL